MKTLFGRGRQLGRPQPAVGHGGGAAIGPRVVIAMPTNSRAMTRVISAAAEPSLIERLGALMSQLRAWIEAGAEHRRAAVVYEKLSALSDAELRNRGLSRGCVVRHR